MNTQPWLDALKNLGDLSKMVKVSLPGLLLAALLVMGLWPPRPQDVIPVIRSDKVPVTFDGKAVGTPVISYRRPPPDHPVCWVDEYELNNSPGEFGMILPGSKEQAKARQFALEQQAGNLDACLAEEKRLSGNEQLLNTDLQRDLAAFESSRNTQVALVDQYEKSVSPLRGNARAHLNIIQLRIELIRAQIQNNEQTMRDREWEIGELTRWKKLVSERLADPGQLRPEVGFDAYVSALSSHVFAFLILATALGILLNGLVAPAALGAVDGATFELAGDQA
jgi:hypothetical protein